MGALLMAATVKHPSYGLVAFTELDTLMVAQVGAIVSFLGENSSSVCSLKTSRG